MPKILFVRVIKIFRTPSEKRTLSIHKHAERTIVNGKLRQYEYTTNNSSLSDNGPQNTPIVSPAEV